MSTALEERPVFPRPGEGGAPARRAMVRWSWRMFRREWRRQALVLALLAVAVAATTVGLAASSNSSGLGPDPVFGTANTIISISGADPHLAADIAAVQSRFARSDVVEHQSVVVPGSVSTVDLRSESPAGGYVRATLRLDRGRYPTGPGQVAVTSGVASLFGLGLGGVWHVDGRSLQVVGLVENPVNLLDEFALVAPGQLTPVANVSILVDASRRSLQSFNLQSGAGIGIESRGGASRTGAEVIVLVLGTVGLLFVGLLAVAGFTVMAQRRLRALGMLASLGATNRHLRTAMLANGAAVGAASALLGTAAGVILWLAFSPTFQSITNHRVDRFDLPWWAIGAAMVLALLTAVGAAWWPARAASRLPVVAALSARPPRPQPAHRFAALGGILLGAGLVLLAFADQRRTAFIIIGTVATVIGLLLLAPLAIRAIAAMGSRLPIAVRLALRDLVRYQARSGAALGAVTLALGIAVTIAISAAAAQAPPGQPNLPTNQLNLYVTGQVAGAPIPKLSPAQQQAGQARVDQLATALHATAVLPLEVAYNPAAGPQAAGPGPAGMAGGQVPVTMAQVTDIPHGQEVSPVAQLYVATPALLAHYGIKPSGIGPTTDVITARSDLTGLQLFAPVLVRAGSAAPAGAGAGPPYPPLGAGQMTLCTRSSSGSVSCHSSRRVPMPSSLPTPCKPSVCRASWRGGSSRRPTRLPPPRSTRHERVQPAPGCTPRQRMLRARPRPCATGRPRPASSSPSACSA